MLSTGHDTDIAIKNSQQLLYTRGHAQNWACLQSVMGRNFRVLLPLRNYWLLLNAERRRIIVFSVSIENTGSNA